MSASVVPARAGMSPSRETGAPPIDCGPRASGDEPAFLSALRGDWEWSPRERG